MTREELAEQIQSDVLLNTMIPILEDVIYTHQEVALSDAELVDMVSESIVRAVYLSRQKATTFVNVLRIAQNVGEQK